MRYRVAERLASSAAPDVCPLRLPIRRLLFALLTTTIQEWPTGQIALFSMKGVMTVQAPLIMTS
jgi:hypothetical protein